MNPLRERDLAPERLPDPVRRRLTGLDRLRDVWVEYQCHRVDDQMAAGRRRLFRWHARELRELAGQGVPVAEPGQRVRDDEDILVEMEADCRSGRRLDGDYFDTLARGLPDFGGAPLPEHTGDLLAEAAAVETHPLVRAAHVHLICEELLQRAEHRGAPPGPPPSLRPLPWALASLSLLRSTYPPLVMDHRLAEAHRAVRTRTDEHERLSALVLFFADLETVSLRSELSWSPHIPEPPEPGRRFPAPPQARRTPASSPPAPLMNALHRRILERLRFRSSSFNLVLHELAPEARTEVTPGGLDVASRPDRCDAAAARALFRRGPRCRWTSLEVAAADAALRLLVLVQDVGSPPTGVLAVTADAWLTTEDRSTDLLNPACTESVTLLPTDSVDDRRAEVEEFVDDVAARAVGPLTRALS